MIQKDAAGCCSIFEVGPEDQFPEGTGVGKWSKSQILAYWWIFVRPGGIGPPTISLKGISGQKRSEIMPICAVVKPRIR